MKPLMWCLCAAMVTAVAAPALAGPRRLAPPPATPSVAQAVMHSDGLRSPWSRPGPRPPFSPEPLWSPSSSPWRSGSAWAEAEAVTAPGAGLTPSRLDRTPPVATGHGSDPSGRAAPSTPAPNGRIREADYAPGAVYRIDGALRTAAQVLFGPGETIVHAAVGDSVAWEVAAEGAVLFLKPREAHGPTNLLVVTERAGAARHYVFDLTIGAEARALYQLRFRYPADERAAAAAAVAQDMAAAQDRLVDLALGQGALEGPRNLAYSVQGDPALQPSEVSDNGRFTVLRFPGGQALPALFETDGESERLVPYDVRGEFVVVHGVVRGLRLRRGDAVLCIFNDAFEDRAGEPATGTASADVRRTDTGDGS